MKILTKTLTELNVGQGRTFAGLTVYPLLGAAGQAPSYRTLDEALAEGSARVTRLAPALISMAVPDSTAACPNSRA